MDLQKILHLAEEKKATDIHFTAWQFPIFRISGVGTIDKQATPNRITRENLESILTTVLSPEQIKHLKEAWIFDKTYVLPRVGNLGGGRYRVHVSRQKDNWDIVFRLLPSRIATLDELNLPPILKKICSESTWGFIVICGVTGTGKSTTLAAMVEYMNQQLSGKSITVIEDPREFFFDDQKCFIKQKALNVDVKSLPAAIQASLRENIDVLCVGECKDPITLREALRVSGSCLVITTFHAISVEQAINRLIYMIPEMEQEEARAALASNMRAILCQKLIRTKQATKWPAVELILNSGSIAEYIRKKETHRISDYVRQHGTSVGMMLMKDAIYALHEKGIISKEEAINSALDGEEMKRMLEGVMGGGKYDIFDRR